MGATLAAALIVGAVAGGSLPAAYTSPEDRYRLAVAVTEDKQDQARHKYAAKRTTEYVTAIERSRSTKRGPASPKYVPPAAPPVIESGGNRQSPDTSPPEPAEPVQAGGDADLAWVLGVLSDYGLATNGSSWVVDGSGSCAHLSSGKWAGCTTMTSPASVRIAPSVIGTQYGAHVVVHEWVHAVERNSNECSTEARTRQITGTNIAAYKC